MKQAEEHPWNVTPEQAREIQLALQEQVITQDRLEEVRFVAGVDVGFEQQNTVSRAAIAVLRFPELQLHEYALARKPVTFPYIPGLLSFREIPVILNALGQLKQQPDLLLCDGQGMPTHDASASPATSACSPVCPLLEWQNHG